MQEKYPMQEKELHPLTYAKRRRDILNFVLYILLAITILNVSALFYVLKEKNMLPFGKKTESLQISKEEGKPQKKDFKPVVKAKIQKKEN